MGPNSIFRIVAKKNTTNGKMGGIGENRFPIFQSGKKFHSVMEKLRKYLLEIFLEIFQQF